MKIETANQLSSRATHAIFFAGFGALWLTLACNARHCLDLPIAVGIAVGLTGLILGAMYLLRLAKEWPRLSADPGVGRTRNWINAALGLVIGVLYFVLRQLNIEAYFLPALTVIVGLHKFSLAWLFRYAPYYAAGAILIVWAAASILLVPAEDLPGITALGTGMILWLNAAVTLAMAWRDARLSKASLIWRLSNSSNPS